MPVDFVSYWGYIFLAVFFIMLCLILLATGVFTAYFGSGRSRTIGGALTFGGIIGLVLIALLFYQDILFPGQLDLWNSVLFPTLVILLAAAAGAGAAIAAFLFAIMKA